MFLFTVALALALGSSTNFVHATLSSDPPEPWNLTEIHPSIIFYRNGVDNITVTHNMSIDDIVRSLRDGGFLAARRFVFVTHGFESDINVEWLHGIKNDILNVSEGWFLNRRDQTVGLLGWEGGAKISLLKYRQAAANVETVGDWLAQVVVGVKQMRSRMAIYGIGHSLGAHVMGMAGRRSHAFNRITGKSRSLQEAQFIHSFSLARPGLDPAGPCFENVNNSMTLNVEDAQFVDIIHTDGYYSKLKPTEWLSPVNHYGSLVPIGTVDFYPNYGWKQPGAGLFEVAGSHTRATELFQWSIRNPGKFVTNLVLSTVPRFEEPANSSVRCGFNVEMGYYATSNVHRFCSAPPLYYIKTRSSEPWV